MAQRVLHVHPTRGQDSRSASSASEPLKTLTEALRRSQDATVIRLQAGVYSQDSGEAFPLTIPSGCQVIGVGGERPAATIQGSGPIRGSALGTQAVSCILSEASVLQSVTVVNRENQGIGIWIAEGRARLEDVAVLNCPQYGTVVLRAALPTIKNSRFEQCGIAGIAFFGQGKGEVQAVTCRSNNTGILIQDTAAPLIQACRLEANRIAVVVTDTANPVLRNNLLINNQTYGLQLTGRSQADFGQSQDTGNNQVRNNGQADVNNRSREPLVSCGNDLLPQRLQGAVQLVASELPDPSVVPVMLFAQPPGEAEPPAPDPVPPEPESSRVGSVQFADMRNHWAGPFVDGLAQAGLVAGFAGGTFRPNQWVTRAQFAAFAVASFSDRPLIRSPQRFRDVPADFWARDALLQAQRMGFLTGFPDGTVRPNEAMVRIQAIVAVTNGLGLAGGRVDDMGIYRDRAQVPSYAVEALATATQRRLVVNYPDPLLLRPVESMTRGEMAALVYQGRVTMGKSSAIASPYIVQPDTSQPLFSDLGGHWASPFIRGLAENSLVSGLKDGRFAPDEPMNRAQFAALVAKAFDPPARRPDVWYRDVPADFWAAEPIRAASVGGFMSGFPDLTFGPSNPMVRVQIWVALVSGLGWETEGIDLNRLGEFADYTTIPRYALNAAAIAVARQLVANYPSRELLRPNQVATRADVCVSVYQALVALGQLPAIAASVLA